MRLKHYINEEVEDSRLVEFDEVIEILKKDCKPFLTEFGVSPYNGLYRGSNKEAIKKQLLTKIRARTKRKPKDIPLHLQKMMDEMFFKKFGWKPRAEGVFVTYSRSFASEYGFPVLFFPKGRYQYVWNEDVEDMYQAIRDEVTYNIDGLNGTMTRDLTKDDIMDDNFVSLLEQLVDGYTNKGFEKVVGAKNEAMFKVYEYYAISTESRYEDVDFLERLKSKL